MAMRRNHTARRSRSSIDSNNEGTRRFRGVEGRRRRARRLTLESLEPRTLLAAGAGDAGPVAVINCPNSVQEGWVVFPDAYGSYDPQGKPLTYAWDFDGDGLFGESSPEALRGDENGEQPAYWATGAEDGDILTIHLRVTNTDNVSAEATAQMTVENRAPQFTAYPGPPGYIMPENTTTGIGFGFQDTGLQDAHTVGIDWGDANAPATATFALPATQLLNVNDVFYSSTDDTTLTITNVDNARWGTVEMLVESHTYLDDGPSQGNDTPFDTSQMVVTVCDDDAAAAVLTVDVEVWNAMSMTSADGDWTYAFANADNGWLMEGSATGMSGGFLDFGLLDTHTVTVQWDDPAAPAVSTFNLPATRDIDLAAQNTFGSATDDAVLTLWYVDSVNGFLFFSVSPHTYAGDGSPQRVSHASMTVRDDDGGQRVGYFDVTVNVPGPNEPPVAIAGGPYTVREGAPWMLDGSASYDPDYQTLLYEWDLDGDGVFGETGPENALRGDETGPQPVFWAKGLDNPDTVTVALRVTDTEGAAAQSTAQINIVNRAPDMTWYPGGYTAPENLTTEYWFGFQDWGIFDTHRITLDWGDANSPAVATFDLPANAQLRVGDQFASTTDGSTLEVFNANPDWFGSVDVRIYSHTYLDDGPSPGNGTPSDSALMILTIRDDDGGETVVSAPAEVYNLDPQITGLQSSADWNTLGVEGQPVQLAATFTDEGTLDLHQAMVDWGDGSPVEPALIAESAGSGGVATGHAYARGGVYDITLTVTDDDGGSAVATTTAAITGAGVHDGVLEIVGTNERDVVSLTENAVGNFTVNAVLARRPFMRSFRAEGIQRVEAWLCSGDDLATAAGALRLPVLMRGGSGNDTLNAGGAAAILIGGEGNDMLLGSAGRDLLIGGIGADRIDGQGESDILVGGTTAYDANDAALWDILQEWTSERGIEARVDNIRNAAGPVLGVKGWRLAHGQTVFDDGYNDCLTGGAGTDWYFSELLRDLATDRKANEFVW